MDSIIAFIFVGCSFFGVYGYLEYMFFNDGFELRSSTHWMRHIGGVIGCGVLLSVYISCTRI